MSSRPARGAARLAAILDALPDALLLVNGNGTVVNANAIAMETLEVPGAPVMGRGLLDIIPDFDPRRIPGSMRRPDEVPGVRTKPTRMIARRTDGSELPVEVTSALLQAGTTPYASAIEAAFADDHAGEELLMLVVRDLSGAVDTEAELVRQQRQTEMILRAASEGVIGVDTAGRVVLLNPAAAQILGHRAGALGGRDLHPLIHHSRPDGTPLAPEDTPLHDTLSSGRKHRVRTGQVLWTKDGEPVPVDMTTAPVRIGDQLVGAVLTFADRRPYDTLAARHAQLHAVLDAGLRGPLDELRGELSGLAADPAGQLWPEANQVLHHLAAGYARMTTLLDNVLSFQRLDAGQEQLERRRVSLDEVITAGLEGATELIGPGRAQFAVHAPPIKADVDPERLAQALAHLVADVAGVDATGRAVPASAASGDSTIVVAAARRGEVVRIEVRGPYTGGDPVHAPLVRGIVRLHGGVLQTHEVPGSADGRAYVLEVPVAADGVEPAPAEPPARAPGDTPPPPRPALGPAGTDSRSGSGGETDGTGETHVPAGAEGETPPEGTTPTGRRRGRPAPETPPAGLPRDGDPHASLGDGTAAGGRRRRALAAPPAAEAGDRPGPAVAVPGQAEAGLPPTGRRRRALPPRPEEAGTAPAEPIALPPAGPEGARAAAPAVPAQLPPAGGDTSAADTADGQAQGTEEAADAEAEPRQAEHSVVAASPILNGSRPQPELPRQPQQALPMPGSGRAPDVRASAVHVQTLGQGIPVAQLTQLAGQRTADEGDTEARRQAGSAPGRRRKLAAPPSEDTGTPAGGTPLPSPPGSGRGRQFAIGAPAAGSAEGPEPLDGPNGAVEVTDGGSLRLNGPADNEVPPEPLDNPRRLLVWPEPDVSTQQALAERGYRPVLVQSRQEVDAQIAAYPAALFVDPLTGPITRTALQSLRQAAVAAEVPVLVTAGLGQAGREAAYGADPAVLLKALAPRDSEQHPPRLLLVEEHQPIADALTAALERRGMQVAHAPSDGEAAELAAQVHPNLVVMDLMQMHRRRTGIIDWLRMNGRLSRTPFVVYTAAEMDQAQLPRLASGETVLFLAERSTTDEVQTRIVDLLSRIGVQ